MLKIILSLLIFTIMPINTMIKASLTFDDMPKEMSDEMFPKGSQEERELLTLIKKFGLKEYSYESGNNRRYREQLTRSRKFIKPSLTNLVTLIRLSQTNRAYYNALNDKIKKRFLSHVSCNSIATYFDHDNCRICEHTICNFNCDAGIQIFYVEYKNPQGFILSVDFTNNAKLKIYDESEYINIHQFYTDIIKNVGNQQIRDLCKKLQEECTITRTIHLQDFDLLKKLLIENKKYPYVNKFNEYSSSTTLAYSIILRFTIFIHNENKFKNIIDSCLDNENLVSIFSKYISTLDNNVLTTYWHSYYSFLQKRDLITWDSLNFDPEYQHIKFSANCGFSNEPTIPVDIICPENICLPTIENK